MKVFEVCYYWKKTHVTERYQATCKTEAKSMCRINNMGVTIDIKSVKEVTA